MKTVYIFIDIKSNNRNNIVISLPKDHCSGSLYFLEHDQELKNRQKRILMLKIAVKKLMK